MEQEKQFLTVPEFADAAGVSQQAVYKQIRNGGRLSAYVVKAGKKIQIDAAALAEIYGLEGLETFSTQKETFSTQNTKPSELSKPKNTEPSELSKPEDTEHSKPSEPDSTHESKPSEPETASKSELQAVLDVLTEQLRVKDEQLKAQAEAQAEAQRIHEEEIRRKDEQIKAKEELLKEIMRSLQAEQHSVHLLSAGPKDKDSDIVDGPETAEAPEADPEDQETEQTAEGMPDKEEKVADPDALERLQAELEAVKAQKLEVEQKLTAEQRKGFFQWLRDRLGGTR